MTELLEGWSLTHHAGQQMEKRGVTRAELDELLARPESMQPSPKDNGCRLYVRGKVIAVVNEAERVVVTVLLQGASREDWERLEAHGLKQQPKPRTKRRRRAVQPAAAVQSRDVLDGVHPSVAERVRRELSAHGLNFAALTEIEPNAVSIKIT